MYQIIINGKTYDIEKQPRCLRCKRVLQRQVYIKAEDGAFWDEMQDQYPLLMSKTKGSSWFEIENGVVATLYCGVCEKRVVPFVIGVGRGKTYTGMLIALARS